MTNNTKQTTIMMSNLFHSPRGNFVTANLVQWENKGWWSTGLFLTLGQIGIFFINDLIKEDGSLLSLTDLKNNYNRKSTKDR
jgi:predicted membrane channel-forming protein YqfA (hemolysin III family)